MFPPKKKTQPFDIHPLRGMDERHHPQPHQARRIRDMTWDEADGWRTAGGFRQIVSDDAEGDNAFDGEGAIVSMHWFAQHNGAVQWLVWEDRKSKGRATLKYFAGGNTSTLAHIYVQDAEANQFNGTTRWRTIVDSPHHGAQSAVYGGRLYLVDGINEPLVFDGRKASVAGYSAGAGAPAPSLPSLDSDALPCYAGEEESGLGVKAKGGARRYRCAFVNERGQISPLSPESAVVQWVNPSSPVGFHRAVATVEMPIGPVGTVARQLYATQNLMDDTGEEYIATEEGALYFFLAQVEDNVSTIYMDLIPDMALGSAIDELDFGPWPSDADLIAVYQNTMWLASTTNNQLRFSAPGMPEVFPADNVFDVGGGGTGPIQSLHAYQGALVVMCTRGIYIVSGDAVSGFRLRPISHDYGAACSAMVEVPGRGLMFLGGNRVYLLSGALSDTGIEANFVPISAPIANQLSRVNWSAIQNARMQIYRRDREVWVALPMMGSAVNNRVLVYHYDIGEWSFRDDFPISCMIETGDHRGLLMFGSHDTAGDLEGIHVYGHGFPTKGGTTIVPMYETVDIATGGFFETWHPTHLVVDCIGYGPDLKLNMTVNRQGAATLATERAVAQLYPWEASTISLWGTAVWGTTGTLWAEHRPVPVRFDISTFRETPPHEVRFTLTLEDRRGHIIGFRAEIDPDSVTRVKALHSAFGGSETR